MRGLEGLGPLARLVVRRDRTRLAVWIATIAVLVYVQAVSVDGLYPTPEQLAAAAELIEGNAAFVALAGPPVALDTLGGRVAFEISAFGIVLAALMNLFLVTRHVRGDEEAGRAELLRSTVVGRHAGVAAALAVALAADTVLAAAVAVSLVGVGLPAGGSVALGVAIGGTGFVFAAVAAVTSQVTVGARTAAGLAGAVLAASYALRAVGDVGDAPLSWFSPIGWGQALRPYAGERWWVVALLAAAATALVALAFRLHDRRDLGAGLVPPRPGPPAAGAALLRPMGLAARLQRGAVAGWAAGLFLGGLAYGSISGDVEDFVDDSEVVAEIVAQQGGDVVDSFLATTALVLALIGAGFTVQAVLRLRAEEVAGRAEPLLATPLPRERWAASHVALAVVGSVAVLAAGGLGTGIAYAALVGGAGDVPRLLAAAVVHTPALLVLAGAALALYGLAPRATAVAWALFALCLVEGFLGSVLSLPGWVEDLSPFRHVPALPAAPFALVPLVVLTVLAAALAAAGLAGLRRRDLAS